MILLRLADDVQPCEPVPFLVLSGPPAVGKTTVSWEIFDQLVDEGHRPALVDIDLLGASWPVPDDDPYNERLKARNLTSVWQNFQRAGARCLIAAGVIENRDGLAMYGAAIPGAVATLCRLTASAPTRAIARAPIKPAAVGSWLALRELQMSGQKLGHLVVRVSDPRRGVELAAVVGADH